MLKRVLDVTVAAGAVTIAAPLMAVIATAIKTGSPGPIFYRGVRVGRDGKWFRIFKFRTMVVNAEKLGGPSTSDDDQRVTPIGRVLRKYKLDELPQLLNVLSGDMSLVGPRPEVPQYVDMYAEDQRAILAVRPGITDWASLWNSDEGALLVGSHDPEKVYLEQIRPQKIRLQLEYVRQQSLLVDLQILARTVRLVLGMLLGASDRSAGEVEMPLHLRAAPVRKELVDANAAAGGFGFSPVGDVSDDGSHPTVRGTPRPARRGGRSEMSVPSLHRSGSYCCGRVRGAR